MEDIEDSIEVGRSIEAPQKPILKMQISKICHF